jgi:glycolate oxidase FAD binding subunit
MSIPLVPTSEAELVDILASAVASKTPLAPVGLGTKSGIGRPVNHIQLHMSGMSGIVDYEPKELVLTVKAGTPVDEVVALLAENGQELPFEPLVWQTPEGGRSRGTIGGLVMTNFSGSRRLKVGAVRDHVLGLRAVSGRAEAFKAGGKVVKNVTGYDLARGLCGSWGTLAVVTEVTFKVLPKAEDEATIIVPGLALADAVAVMTGAMQQSFDVSSAAHLPDGRTLIRLEGFEASVKARIGHAKQFIGGRPGMAIAEGEASRDLWIGLNNTPATEAEASTLWRISAPPTAATAITQAIRSGLKDLSPRFTYDWSGGLIWLALDVADGDLGSAIIRSAIASNGGGHATLMRGPIEARGRIDVFEPQPPTLAALSKRLKHQFDPEGILNPGRMSADA